MPMWKGLTRKLAVSALALFVAAPAVGQQMRGTPGAPNATMFPDSRQLPVPTPPFAGSIAPNVGDSAPGWPPAIAAPANAPNVLLILTDDVGFAAPSTFGGVIPTPALDRIAQAGLRYTSFHTTALCSPTRAALLTGRNHHAVGFGQISELSTGFPGYNSMIPPETVTIGETLRLNGFATAWFGKNHNTPPWEASPVGPFQRWPTGLGFEYFYGFVGGDTNQWQPGNLYRNTTPIYPFQGRPGWNLTTAMADDAIGHIRTLAEVAPGRPWFIHYAPGGTHAPHHPTPEWIERFRGKFDMGWNALREQIFQNQQRLGVIPSNARLTPWPDFLKNWDSLSADEKRLFTRQAEVYAAYLAYTDSEIGRVIAELDRLGQFENTLIIYISGDNGASSEGTLNGTFNEVAYFNGVEIPVPAQLARIDQLGSDRTYNHMAAPWAWSFATPYRWVKQVASHLGGTRNGMAVSWPRRITDRGGIRHQFHHVIDVVPTILDAVGVPEPNMVNGIAQRPIEGVSMAYTFDAANASAPSRRRTQYFEMFGNRAIYHDGWLASTTPSAPPWDSAAPRPADAMNGFKWELYDLTADPTQANDVATANPDRLRSLQEIFLMEATRYNVLPLDASGISRMIAQRPGPAAGRRQFTYSGPISGLQANAAPSIINKAYTITAEITVPQGGGNGVLVTQGGRFGGWALYLQQGRPVFNMNLIDLERIKWEGRAALTPGTHTIVFEWTPEATGMPFGRGGTGVLRVDGQEVARRAMAKSTPFTFAWDETFDVGLDTGTSVDDGDYQSPNAFTGTINRVTVDLGASTINPESMRLLQEATRQQQR